MPVTATALDSAHALNTKEWAQQPHAPSTHPTYTAVAQAKQHKADAAVQLPIQVTPKQEIEKYRQSCGGQRCGCPVLQYPIVVP